MRQRRANLRGLQRASHRAATYARANAPEAAMTEPTYARRPAARLPRVSGRVSLFLFRAVARLPWRARARRRCLVSAGRAGHAGLSAAHRLRRHGLLDRPAGAPHQRARACRGVPAGLREAGLGLATGWAVALVCVLPLTVFGGIAISILAAGLIVGLARGRRGILCAGRSG